MELRIMNEIATQDSYSHVATGYHLLCLNTSSNGADITSFVFGGE